MYSKSEPLRQSLDTTSAENLADILSEIGKDSLAKQDFPMAVKWLERAFDVINSKELERLSREAVELRISICHAFVRALLGIGTLESTERAENLVGFIESEIGDEPVVLLLRLEMVQKAPAEVFDADVYADILRRMIRSFDFSDAHFKLATHHIRKLYDKSPGLGSRVLSEMLRTKILQSGVPDWIERVVILRIWMTINSRESPECTTELIVLLTEIQENLEIPLRSTATIAAQTVSFHA
jgi:hypothetical protein